MLTKDLNFVIFSDISGRITETYQIEWSRFFMQFLTMKHFLIFKTTSWLTKESGIMDFIMLLLDLLSSRRMTQSNG